MLFPSKKHILAVYYKPRRKFGFFYRFFKRLFDIIGGLIGLIVFIPFWIIIYILIKFDSRGRVIFRQERVGLNEKIFKMYKFRTMKIINDQPSPKSRDDSRITAIGKFLRKYSLDELPQLINVIKGDMSLVGPRPEMPCVVNKYQAWQKQRFLAKPGLTGLWQIMGRKDLPLFENTEFDLYYVNNRSLLLDFTILIITPLIVLRGKGAY